jgi:2-keto-4-pentenoate hydratase
VALSTLIRTAIADEVQRTRGVPIQVSPFSLRHPEMDLSDSYWVVEEIRRRRQGNGEKVIGRKIGFTNFNAWKGYSITGPIWNYLYASTTFELSAKSSMEVSNWPEVRMETEVALGLSARPNASMDEEELLNCVEWAALDFEVCSSIFLGGKSKSQTVRQRASTWPFCLENVTRSVATAKHGPNSSTASRRLCLETMAPQQPAGAHRCWEGRSRHFVTWCRSWIVLVVSHLDLATSSRPAP